jgi:hypothetical protein
MELSAAIQYSVLKRALLEIVAFKGLETNLTGDCCASDAWCAGGDPLRVLSRSQEWDIHV